MSPQCYTLNKFITKPIFFFTITKAYGAFRLKVAWEESTVRWTDQKTPLFLLFFPILLRREKYIHPLEETAMHTGNFLIEQPKKKRNKEGGENKLPIKPMMDSENNTHQHPPWMQTGIKTLHVFSTAYNIDER